MTPTQLLGYLTGGSGTGTRCRMPRDEAAQWCRQRRRQKQAWIREMMEDNNHGR